MANGIDIVIGGEVSGALAAMTAVEQRTLVLQSRIAKLQQVAGTTQNIDKLNKSLQLLGRTQSELGRLSGAGSFSGVTKGSNEATASLINLSRVAQDAPYGFIGIANNINPLLESFQRLKASTGTTGGALKALGSSLVGGGGLGLAIGVVSSLLVVFGDKIFGAGKKTKEANEEYERLNKVIKEVSRSAAEVSAAGAASTVDERARVSILANAVRDQTKSYNERNNALNQLKEINKNYFGDLTLETASLATLTARVDEYSKALISAAIVKEFSSDIAKTAVETSKAGQKYNQLSDDVEKLNAELSRTPKQIRELRGSAGGGNYVTETNKEYTRLTEKLNEANDALFEQGQILSKLDDISTSARNGLSKAIEDGLKLKPLTSTGVKVNADKVEVKPKSVVIDFNQGVSDKQIADLTKYMFDKSVKFDFIAPELIPPEEAKQQGLTFSQMFGHEVEKYFKQTDPIDFGLNKAVREFKPPKTFSFKMFEGLNEEQLKLAESAELITNTLAPAFDNLINAIGRGENAFQAFGEGVKQVLVQVISKLVQTALLAAALSAIFPGGLGGAKGFGAIFSSLLGFGGARAGGGPVSFGKSYLVGENGPELFVPSNSGSIMNQRQIAAMSYSGGGSSGGGRQIIRGQNIILSYARTNRAQNRLGRG